MRTLYLAVKKLTVGAILCFFIALNAFADLETLLSDEIKAFKNGLEVKQDIELIALADLLSGSGISDDELYSVVEERTRNEYAKHISNPRDKQVAKNFNALMRAYGSFGKLESSEFIISVVSSSKSRGVSNRAHRLHPKLGWFKRRNELMQNKAYYKEGQDLMTHRFMGLINDSDPSMRRWASEEIKRRGGTEGVVYSAMANTLKEEGKNIKSASHLDSLAWYCKILAKFSPQEHGDLLLEIQSGGGYHKKLKKYARF